MCSKNCGECANPKHCYLAQVSSHVYERTRNCGPLTTQKMRPSCRSSLATQKVRPSCRLPTATRTFCGPQLPAIHVCRRASSSRWSIAVASTESRHLSSERMCRKAVNLIAPGPFRKLVASFRCMAGGCSEGFNKDSTWDAKLLPS